MVVVTTSPRRAHSLSSELLRAHSAPCFAMSANMRTRTSPEIAWGSIWTAFKLNAEVVNMRMLCNSDQVGEPAAPL
eukprot:2041832-Alexandrium_andersonii.AAC.1